MTYSSAISLALLLSAPIAIAKQSDSEQPLNVKANHVGGSLNAGVTVLDQGIEISQGTLKANADRGEIHRTEEREISKVVLTGKPARMQQELEDGQRLEASAATITYQLGVQTIELSGSAVITRGKDRLSGALIVYEVASGKYSADGQGAPVEFSIQPKTTKDKAASEPQD